MKKFVKLFISLMFVCTSMLTFTSCGMPADYMKATDNLESNGYEVEQITARGALNTVASTFGLENNSISKVIYAEKIDGDDGIEMYFLKESKNVKKVKDKLKEKASGEKKVGSSGKVIWLGTKDAVKSAKKVSAVPKKSDKLKENLKNNGYTFPTETNEISYAVKNFATTEEKVKEVVGGINGDDFIIVIYCKNTTATKEIKSQVEKLVSEHNAESSDKYVCIYDGKMVWYGTRKAIDDAK